MKWKCNSMGCEYEFEDKTTEEEIEKDDFKLPLCPKCKNKYNKCYRK